MGKLKSFQLLEINIISAQDLEPVSKKMRTYATAWMHSNRKLSSCVDTEGNNNPTWNDKFVFRVDEEFLRQDTSAVMIEIYANHWLRDVLVGTVRVLVGNLIPPPSLARGQQGHMRFVALQVRRPSGRPQGILNIGVSLLDSSMKSMPLYRQLSMSAIGIRDLMEGSMNFRQTENPNNGSQVSTMKPILRRSKSERSELVGLDNHSPSGSIVGIKIKPKGKDSSILSITDGVNPFQDIHKIGKASSVISGAELREKPKHDTKNRKAGSVVSDSIFSKESSSFRKMAIVDSKPSKQITDHEKTVDEKSVTINKESKPVYKKGNSVWSDSEVGPSPSEVAANIMAERKYPLKDNQSSVLDGWSVDESVEGLRSKLERWRMDLPPLYDRTGFSTSSYTKSSTGAGRHGRRYSDSESNGLFSCFGNIFGYECQCICGKPPGAGGGKRSRSATFHSPSTLTPGRSYM
ncbi:hypothetical protein CASFOL_030040 [Castilleja foliolosa]|uniref:C2 domain-containing protein n=1 Tax=Castilleja foliolosa TaxID=1961234 RepID=A0ABD3CAY8_9LAMI